MARSSRIGILIAAIIILMVVVGVVLAVVISISGGRGVSPSWGQRIALLEINGVIDDDRNYLEQIRALRRDASVKGYLVVINSPGGVVAPAQSLYQELKRIRSEDEVPVIASIGAVGASGGYLVALGADSIFALPGSLTGSIGVIMEVPQVEELMDRVGVEIEVVKSAEFKDVGSPFRPFSTEDREVLQGLVQDVYAQFVNVVADERGLAIEDARRLADGRIFSGDQALNAGLIDRTGNLNDALAATGRMAGIGDDPRIVRPPQRSRISLLDVLLGQGALSGLARLVRPLDEAAGPRLQYITPFHTW